MDTDELPSLPNLAKMHALLAVNNRRVEAVVDARLDAVERLFSATTSEDWEAVAKATKFLAALDPNEIDENILRTAQKLCEEIGREKEKMKRPKHLSTLLEACRAAKKKE